MKSDLVIKTFSLIKVPLVRGKAQTTPLFNLKTRDQVIKELKEENFDLNGNESITLQTISENQRKLFKKIFSNQKNYEK